MKNIEIQQILAEKGVKPTANRILVAKTIALSDAPVSLADLETALSPMDKASIFRVLTVLADAEVVHSFEDGSGSVKYEACHGAEHVHTIDDMHPHFHCQKCGRTYCIDTAIIPKIVLPDGFEAHSINYLIKGLCPRCLH